ncbi:hypothetical protein AQI96_09220 [Streptomyces canus]|nr:hypothetical protein AQI96_09220 [Streptomyces canus]
MPGLRSLTPAEKPVAENLGGFPFRPDRMVAAANIHRAASAMRRHLENSVLPGSDLTWTAFVSETRHVAEDAGISKSTLAGVADHGVAWAAEPGRAPRRWTARPDQAPR